MEYSVRLPTRQIRLPGVPVEDTEALFEQCHRHRGLAVMVNHTYYSPDHVKYMDMSVLRGPLSIDAILFLDFTDPYPMWKCVLGCIIASPFVDFCVIHVFPDSPTVNVYTVAHVDPSQLPAHFLFPIDKPADVGLINGH
jgi:hypothetical protein